MIFNARIFVGVMLVELLLALVACDMSSATSTPSPQPRASVAATAAPTALPSSTPLAKQPNPRSPSDTLAILRRSGGLARLSETFVIKSDGTIQANAGVLRARGGAEAASKLAARIAATNIYSIKPGEYLPANACCDRVLYELMLMRNGQAYEYVTMDSAENAPRPLQETLALIQEYIESAS